METIGIEPEKRTCPLTTLQLCDLVVQFVSIYNEPAGIVLYSYQRLFMRRIVESILDDEGATITGLWSRQSGKSESLASLASALCLIIPTLRRAYPDDTRFTRYASGFWIGIFAPKQQQSDYIYSRIRTRAESDPAKGIYSDPDISVDVATSRGDVVSWTNGSFVNAKTASEQSNVEGGTYHLVIIDEAQIVGEVKVNKEIRPMLAATNGTMLMIGTANNLRGNFKKVIQQNIEIEKQGGKRNHFEFPYELVIQEKRKTYEKTGDRRHLAYEKWVETELRRLGGNKENEEFRQNFRLMWQEANSGAIDRDTLYEAGDYDREFEEYCLNKRVVAGLDYGRKRDVTILTIAEVGNDQIIDTRAVVRPGEEAPIFYEKTIIAWYEIPGRKWFNILNDVVEALQRYSVDTVVADGTGVGDPLTEQLASLIPGVKIIPFVMSHVGNDMIYKFYIQELEAGRLRYVAGDNTRKLVTFENFLHEHEELLRERVGVYMRCFAPEGEHDDYADSGALCCWATSLPESDEFVVSQCSPIYDRQRNASNGGRANRYRR
jgi:hypothetical protein